jgi:hypothetical protein
LNSYSDIEKTPAESPESFYTQNNNPFTTQQTGPLPSTCLFHTNARALAAYTQVVNTNRQVVQGVSEIKIKTSSNDAPAGTVDAESSHEKPHEETEQTTEVPEDISVKTVETS